mgnify:CR=1 FL=1|jgi:pleckstrin family protein A (phosphoinositide binding specific) protein 8
MKSTSGISNVSSSALARRRAARPRADAARIERFPVVVARGARTRAALDVVVANMPSVEQCGLARQSAPRGGMPSRVARVIDALDALDADVEFTRPGDVDAARFCDVMDAMLEVIAALGFAFELAKADVSKNVRRIRDVVRARGEARASLFEAIARDREAGGRVWVPALWLRRFGGFVVGLLGELTRDASLDLRTCGARSYERALKPYHGFALRGVFAAALAMPPSRAQFCAVAGSEEEMRACVAKFAPVMDALDGFLTAEGLNDPTPV